MQTLNIDANLARPDDFYELLIDTHRDLTCEESELVNCKLILLLANHIGDADVIRDAMRRARDGVASTTMAAASAGVTPPPDTTSTPSDDPTMPAIPSPS